MKVELQVSVDMELDDVRAEMQERLNLTIKRQLFRALSDAVVQEVERAWRQELRSALVDNEMKELAHMTAKKRFELALAEMDKAGIR